MYVHTHTCINCCTLLSCHCSKVRWQQRRRRPGRRVPPTRCRASRACSSQTSPPATRHAVLTSYVGPTPTHSHRRMVRKLLLLYGLCSFWFSSVFKPSVAFWWHLFLSACNILNFAHLQFTIDLYSVRGLAAVSSCVAMRVVAWRKFDLLSHHLLVCIAFLAPLVLHVHVYLPCARLNYSSWHRRTCTMFTVCSFTWRIRDNRSPTVCQAKNDRCILFLCFKVFFFFYSVHYNNVLKNGNKRQCMYVVCKIVSHFQQPIELNFTVWCKLWWLQ